MIIPMDYRFQENMTRILHLAFNLLEGIYLENQVKINTLNNINIKIGICFGLKIVV